MWGFPKHTVKVPNAPIEITSFKQILTNYLQI